MEVASDSTYQRTMRLAHGTGTAELILEEGYVLAHIRLDDLRDLTSAVSRCRTLLDLDADTVEIDSHLQRLPYLRPLLRQHRGLRSPGCVDGFELGVRAILGQQVSVASARAAASRLVAEYGDPASLAVDGLHRLFPRPEVLAEVSAPSLKMPLARARCLIGLAAAVRDGLALDSGVDREQSYAALVALPGIGPWTARYIAMRALGDTDVLLLDDLHVRRQLSAIAPGTALEEVVEHARPWGSYLTHLLWRNS